MLSDVATPAIGGGTSGKKREQLMSVLSQHRNSRPLQLLRIAALERATRNRTGGAGATIFATSSSKTRGTAYGDGVTTPVENTFQTPRFNTLKTIVAYGQQTTLQFFLSFNLISFF